MKAEIIAVGTELLLGQIVNTNAQYLSRELAALGVDMYYQTVVGDNESRLLEAIRIASGRADLVIMTGGIGPTQDDLTKDTLARYVGKGLSYHQPSLDKIEQLFRSRNLPITDSNRRQAYILDDSEPLFNETGLAVGVALRHERNLYIVLPGPPREMKPMFATYASAWIRSNMGEVTPLVSKILKFSGIGESSLEKELDDLIRAQTDVTIAPYAQEGEVALRLSTKASSPAEAEQKLHRTETAVRDKVGQYLFAETDIPLEQVVVDLLRACGKTVATAESCTGGVLSGMITSVPGSSAAFKGGFITYTNAVKQKQLDVPSEWLEGEGAPGAVSAETAERMALGALKRMDTDYALAVTGVAGPDRSEGKPVGLVYVALASKSGGTEVKQYQMTGSREIIRYRAAKFAMHQLWLAIRQDGT